jgi:hypothetical protein
MGYDSKTEADEPSRDRTNFLQEIMCDPGLNSDTKSEIRNKSKIQNIKKKNAERKALGIFGKSLFMLKYLNANFKNKIQK